MIDQLLLDKLYALFKFIIFFFLSQNPENITKTKQAILKLIFACYNFLYTDKKHYPVEEGMEFTLQFEEPGISYDTMTWYKSSRSYTVVSFDPDEAFGQTQYYGDYCSGSEPCNTSMKAEFDSKNGNLFIYALNLTEDEDYYYYEFTSFDTRQEDTGLKYEIYLEVFGKKLKYNGVFPKLSRTFIAFSDFSEFRESDKLLKHELLATY